MKTPKKRVAITVRLTEVHCRRVVRGIAAFGAEAGWEWLLMPLEDTIEPILSLELPVDGMIGCFDDIEAARDVAHLGIPAVNISTATVRSNMVCVAVDDVAVGRVAAEYLLSLGIVHFGFFGLKGSETSQLRERGFDITLRAAGFQCRSFHSATNRLDKLKEELAQWITPLPKPIGILASSDQGALQLLSACHRNHIAVSEEVIVLGIGNDDVLCSLANPTLSSVALSAERIGYESARVLGRLMRGRKPGHHRMLIPPTGVVPRQSSRRNVIVDPEVAAAVRYIAQHVQDDLQVADVLHEVLVSRRSLDQRFRKILGRTPAQEISRAQVEMAKRVLAETDEPMPTVAAMAGFSNAKQFGATFRFQAGIAPSAYRREHQK